MVHKCTKCSTQEKGCNELSPCPHCLLKTNQCRYAFGVLFILMWIGHYQNLKVHMSSHLPYYRASYWGKCHVVWLLSRNFLSLLVGCWTASFLLSLSIHLHFLTSSLLFLLQYHNQKIQTVTTRPLFLHIHSSVSRMQNVLKVRRIR